MKKPPDWTGRDIVCIASGPSLTEADCDLARASGRFTIAVNSTVFMAPWAHAMYAGDSRWWKEYGPDLADYKGERFSFTSIAKTYGAHSLALSSWFANPGNSGAGAISLAMAGGASRITLLGYDCDTTDGLHWHGPHRGSLTNCLSAKRWPAQFGVIAKAAAQRGIKVVNASRKTALECFPKLEAEYAL